MRRKQKDLVNKVRMSLIYLDEDAIELSKKMH
jgi:hypothetical protein